MKLALESSPEQPVRCRSTKRLSQRKHSHTSDRRTFMNKPRDPDISEHFEERRSRQRFEK
jgi:hypothetical protein